MWGPYDDPAGSAALKVEMVRWKDPSRVTRDDYPSETLEDQALVDLLDSIAEQPFKPAGVFVGGPFGIIPAAPQNSPSELYDLWVMHADRRITPAVQDVVVGVEGVEIFRPWTPYRAWLGIGRMFDREKVFQEIRRSLATTG